uniref:Transposase-associated domain-containing protein n=1 Tax=Triticum urartu TaxID=4572 RepID=A0A8R7UBZ5_TRIUA
MDRSVKGFLNFTVANMIQKGEVHILCPCLTCENGVLHNPFKGSVLAHVLRRSFVAGDTRWPKHGEEDVSDDGGNNDAENSGDEQAEPPEGGNNEHAHGGGNDEMPPEHEEDHETVTQDMSLATMLQDPHVKDLLRKKTTSERDAIKEAVKLAQFEIDTKTPLYEGCNPRNSTCTSHSNFWTSRQDSRAHMQVWMLHWNIYTKFCPRGIFCLAVSMRQRRFCVRLICHM